MGDVSRTSFVSMSTNTTIYYGGDSTQTRKTYTMDNDMFIEMQLVVILMVIRTMLMKHKGTPLPGSEIIKFMYFQPFTPPRILKPFVENAWWECITSKDFVVQLIRAHFASRHPGNNKVSSKVQKMVHHAQHIRIQDRKRRAPSRFEQKSHFYKNQNRGNKKTVNPSGYAHMFHAANSLICIDATLWIAILGGNWHAFTSKRIFKNT